MDKKTKELYQKYSKFFGEENIKVKYPKSILYDQFLARDSENLIQSLRTVVLRLHNQSRIWKKGRKEHKDWVELYNYYMGKMWGYLWVLGQLGDRKFVIQILKERG
ncbi:MAG TPA: hypothetical protein ENH85_05455, partial [Candidatus Scalindua sp.]|nr:hypothetical protein [Candidatus Scalindua sp.]